MMRCFLYRSIAMRRYSRSRITDVRLGQLGGNVLGLRGRNVCLGAHHCQERKKWNLMAGYKNIAYYSNLQSAGCKSFTIFVHCKHSRIDNNWTESRSRSLSDNLLSDLSPHWHVALNSFFGWNVLRKSTLTASLHCVNLVNSNLTWTLCVNGSFFSSSPNSA